MKSEIAPSITIAPIAMINALLPLSPLSGVELLVTAGVVTFGTVAGACGTPGLNGLPVGPGAGVTGKVCGDVFTVAGGLAIEPAGRPIAMMTVIISAPSSFCRAALG